MLLAKFLNAHGDSRGTITQFHAITGLIDFLPPMPAAPNKALFYFFWIHTKLIRESDVLFGKSNGELSWRRRYMNRGMMLTRCKTFAEDMSHREFVLKIELAIFCHSLRLIKIPDNKER